jgi:hypothetical protein
LFVITAGSSKKSAKKQSRDAAESSSSSEETDEKAKKRRKAKKKKSGRKKARRVSSSSSDDSEESSRGNSSSSSSGSLSSDESSSQCGSSDRGEGKKVAKRGKKKRITDGDWELLEELWPAEERPARLQSRKAVAALGLSMTKLLKMKDLYVKEQEKKGVGAALFGRDKKPKKKKFKKMTDNGEEKLHPARFIGLPRVDPKVYWSQVPGAADEIYRHVPLEHLGVEGVQEQTIVRMHNRRVPIELEGLLKDCKDAKQMQMAVFNYVAVLRSLHPIDYGGLVILRVLIEAAWGENLGSEKQRMTVMKKFFEDVVKENSGRAVRKEVPLDYEQAKVKWTKAVTAVFPQLTMFPYVQQLPAGAGRQDGAGSTSGVTARGQKSGGRGGFAGNFGGGAHGGSQRTPARFNGLPVCFPFNSREGCKRPPQGNKACKDGSNVFAHVCNFYIKGVAGQQDRHCLGGHSRVGNH